VKVVDVIELKTMRDMGRTLSLVDTRPTEDYEQEHLPGAKNLPMGEGFATRAARWLPKRGTMVVYGHEPTEAAERLSEAGWPVVRYLPRALAEWQKLGVPLEPSDEHRPVPTSWEP
jgi:rhodanese-related sulfurtransferase